jgi:hypothetical protein
MTNILRQGFPPLRFMGVSGLESLALVSISDDISTLQKQ